MACIRKYRGSWVADWRDPSGKRFIETIDGDRQDAENRLAEVVKSGKAPASKRLKFKEQAEWWLENIAKGSVKRSTYEEYERSLKVHVYLILGDKPLVKITRDMMLKLIASKRKENVSASTIRNFLAPVRSIYYQAMESGLCHKNPAARLGKFNKEKEKEPGQEINPLTREEVAKFLRHHKGSHWYPVFLLAVRTGLRMGEQIALKPSDLDFNNRQIEVRRNISRGEISTPKSRKGRKVDMSLQLAEALKEMLSKRRAAMLRAEIKKPAQVRVDVDEAINNGWLFQTLSGTRLDSHNLRKVFVKALDDAKTRRIRYHDLRHTFASLLLQNRESLAYVKDQMGHHSIQITVDIYGHLVPGGNRSAVDALDDVENSVAAPQE